MENDGQYNTFNIDENDTYKILNLINLVNGNILLVPSNDISPTNIYEYNPISNTTSFTTLNESVCFKASCILGNGNVLLYDYNTRKTYIYNKSITEISSILDDDYQFAMLLINGNVMLSSSTKTIIYEPNTDKIINISTELYGYIYGNIIPNSRILITNGIINTILNNELNVIKSFSVLNNQKQLALLPTGEIMTHYKDNELLYYNLDTLESKILEINSDNIFEDILVMKTIDGLLFISNDNDTVRIYFYNMISYNFDTNYLTSQFN
jgi:hypothetical protein